MNEIEKLRVELLLTQVVLETLISGHPRPAELRLVLDQRLSQGQIGGLRYAGATEEDRRFVRDLIERFLSWVPRTTP